MPHLGNPARDNGTQNVQVLRKRIRFSDAATAVTVGVIPAGAIVLPGSGVQVITAFNDSGTDLLDIGTTGDADEFASAIVISAVGYIVVDDIATHNGYDDTTDVTVTATYTGQNSNSTAGVADVVILFATKSGGY